MSISTPWGRSDYTTSLSGFGDEVVQASTPGHGGIGILIMGSRFEQLSAKAKKWGQTCAGRIWFEEDCDWAIVAHEFPDLFSEEHQRMAEDSLKTWNRDYLGLEPETAHRDETERFARTAWGDWHETVPEGFVGVILGDGERGSENLISGLLPAEDYASSENRGAGPTSERVVKILNLNEDWTAPGATKQAA